MSKGGKVSREQRKVAQRAKDKAAKRQRFKDKDQTVGFFAQAHGVSKSEAIKILNKRRSLEPKR